MSETTKAAPGADRLAQAKRLLLEKRLRGEVKPGGASGRIPRAGGGPAYEMSYQQEQLWFLDQLQPGSPFYNIPGANLVSARIDVPTLERALSEVVRRHAGLRTVFRMVDGRPMQIVLPPYHVRVEQEDLRGPGGEDVPAEVLRRKASEWGALPMDLATGPLLRWKLYRLSEADCLLVFNVHHIVTDGWSMPIVTREMEELYEAYAAGLPSPLPELEIQYHDYSVWQREHLQGPVLQKQLDHWKRHLGGAPTTLELPYDRPRPAVQSNRGTMYRFVYPGALVERLRAIGRQEGASINMVFMAGFNLLLQRYSGQGDLVVGTLLGNRNRAELESVVGYLVNSGAIRTRLDGDPTFREVVRQVRTAILEADAAQEVPFDMVVDALKVPRDPSRNPLFQAMYFHHTFVGSHHLDEEEGMSGSLNLRSLYQETEVVLVDTGAAKFDMTWATLELHDAMPSMVEYNTDLFDEATIARMVEHLRVLLDDACDRPDVPVSQLEMASEEERRALLAWGVNERPYPRDETLVSLFARQAAATPDAEAVEFEDATWSYRELDERSNRVARHLAKLGAGPGTAVGLATEMSAATVLGLVGIIKAGATAVPLDAEYPLERLDFMVQDTGARILVTTGGVLEETAAHHGAALVRLDADWPSIERESADPVEAGCTPETVAYLIYTSGSTGTPKGVRMHHRAIVRTVVDTDYYDMGPGGRIGQQSSLSFDSSVWEVWGALLNGGTLVMISRDFILSPAGYAALLREKRIGTVFLTTQLFNQLVREVPDVLSCVDQVCFGGEKVDAEAVRLCVQGGPPRKLLHVYGPTEGTVYTTVHRVTGVPADAHTVPIGRPIANARVYIVTPGGRLAGVGVPGELWVGGDGVALGYHARPELDAERFVADPFYPGGRAYRTGDRVRWVETASAKVRECESALGSGADDSRTFAPSYSRTAVLEFVGRTDDQVKVRGFRIELGEVEAALRKHPGLRDAAVVARDDAGAERKLVGYVVPEDAEPSAAELRLFMKEHLPDYMVPTVFVTLDALPVSPNGKVDRKKLPAPGSARLATGDEYVAPTSPVEEALARVWAEVLRVERVGIHDNFFSLGGDSILSIQVIARAGEAGLRVTPRSVFMHQTIAELAAVVGHAAAPVAEQGAVTGDVPLTPVQRWFLEQDTPDPHHFNLVLLFAAREPVDAAALERACAALLAHHDALRLRYTRGEDGWRQSNAGPSPETPFEVIDLSAVEADAREAAFTARSAVLQRSLELERGPLVRFALFRMGDVDRVLVVAHHLAIDAVTMGFLAQDLETAYRQAAAGGDVSLPPKTTSFRQWAAKLAEHARSGEVRAQAAYWLGQGDAPPLPVDGAGANTEGEAGRISVELGAEDTRALLQEVPPVYQTQVNDVLLAALARAFRGWTGARSLRVDLEGHGREDLFDGVDLSRTAGWFTAIYPVVLELPEQGGEGDAIKAVKEQLRAVPGKGISHGLLRWLSEDGEIQHALRARPAAQVSFNYLGRMDVASDAAGLFAGIDAGAGLTRSSAAARTHLLAVDAAVIDGRLHATWSYGPGVHRRETVERLAEAFAAELRALIEHCRHPEAGGYTPSDFALAGLDQAALDALLSQGMERENVEDIYPLSPLQHGMLFHAVYSGGAAYQEQFPLLLVGEVDVDALERAFRGVVARHGALRTGFAWEGVPQPLQLVLRRAEPAFERLDWSDAGDGWRERVDALLDADLRRGYDLRRPPLLRVTLARIDGGRHLLLLSMHHLVIDGWSLPLLLADLDALYHAARTGRPAALPPAPRYRDYVQWLVGRDTAAAEAFWRRSLAGFGHATPLPLDPGGAPHASSHGKETLRLEAGVFGRAQAFARAQGVTLNTVAQAAWALLLARHAGEDDVVFGATVSGRPPEVAGVERTVGLFINTLPVRVRLDAEARVGDWLRAVQQAHAETRQYEYARLVDVHGWSEVPREAPLFESVLVFENYPVQMGAADDGAAPLQVEPLPAPERGTYALSLICAPWPDGLELRLSYDAARFTPDTARRILAGAAAALAAVVADPDAAVGALSVLTARDRAEADAWGRGPRVEVPFAPVHETFAAQAALTPSAVAVRAPDGSLTYAALDARAERIASVLRARGVGRGALAAVFLERSADLPAALLGVLKAGAAYVPIDPAYPAERVRWMLEDSRAGAVLTTSALAASLPESAATLLLLDPLAAESAEAVTRRGADQGVREGGLRAVVAADSSARSEAGGVPVDPAELAYVIYTSGSTGRPKGVEVTHGNAANLLPGAVRAFGAEPGIAVLHATSTSFDASLLEVFVALLSGAALHVADREVVLSPERLAPLLREREIGVWVSTPALLDSLPEADFPALRAVSTGGERCSAETAARWSRGRRLVNMYGPTETTIYTTAHACAPGVAEAPPIGRPVANARVYVLDACGEPVPAGAPGELHVGGAGVARGYLGRAALTAERFVPDPFGGEPGARMYRTGDRACWRADGELEFLGRIDAQVKVRGVRVEPGEVEAALRALPGVREAAVAVRGEGAAARLVAWVVGEGDPSALAGALRAVLPEAMVPSLIAVVDALPRTASGKLDRRALPDPQPAPAAVYVEPRTATERALAEVWRDVLGVERIGVEDSFFAAGGHSLLAMQVASRVRAALGVDLPVRALFDHPRLADLAAWIDGEGDAEVEALLRELEGMTDAEAAAALGDGGEG
ncbi:MAG: amino acid adenylation domain-containing protein [Longimicrobiaceae bacterium]